MFLRRYNLLPFHYYIICFFITMSTEADWRPPFCKGRPSLIMELAKTAWVRTLPGHQETVDWPSQDGVYLSQSLQDRRLVFIEEWSSPPALVLLFLIKTVIGRWRLCRRLFERAPFSVATARRSRITSRRRWHRHRHRRSGSGLWRHWNFSLKKRWH